MSKLVTVRLFNLNGEHLPLKLLRVGKELSQATAQNRLELMERLGWQRTEATLDELAWFVRLAIEKNRIPRIDL